MFNEGPAGANEGNGDEEQGTLQPGSFKKKRGLPGIILSERS